MKNPTREEVERWIRANAENEGDYCPTILPWGNSDLGRAYLRLLDENERMARLLDERQKRVEDITRQFSQMCPDQVWEHDTLGDAMISVLRRALAVVEAAKDHECYRSRDGLDEALDRFDDDA